MNSLQRWAALPLILLTALLTLGWGEQIHKVDNGKMIAHLPPELKGFTERVQLLIDSASVPDWRKYGSNGYTLDPNEPDHFFNLDYYPEYKTHTVSMNLDTLMVQHTRDTVLLKGFIPWVAVWTTDSLAAQMQRGDWTKAWSTAACLGHYVADIHCPMHVTINYNGQLTGQTGLHSRYEGLMFTADVLASLMVIPEGVSNISNPIAYLFDRTYESNSYVDSILAADLYARGLDGTYGDIYKAALWEKTKNFTQLQVQRATKTFADLLYTAWIKAGRPEVPAVNTGTINTFDVFAGDPRAAKFITGTGSLVLSDNATSPSPIEGTAALKAVWTIDNSETWGGNISLSTTTLPNNATSIDISTANYLSLWFYNQTPSSQPGLVTFRLKLREAGGASAYPVDPNDYEEWQCEKAGVFDAAPGWNNIRIPLVDRGKVNPTDQGLSLPGWSGRENNGTLDLNKIVGFCLDWVSTTIPTRTASGVILFDKLEAISVDTVVTNGPTVITFQANLGTLLLTGFDPAADSIVVNGSMNGWNAPHKMFRVGTTSLWQDTVQYLGAVGDTLQYKFRAFPVTKFANNGYELDQPTRSGNREFIVPATSAVLPSIMPQISLKDSVAIGVKVTFQVNMNEQIRIGKFSAATDKVALRGIDNNWDPGVQMSDPNSDGIYTIVMTMTPNTQFQYKFFVSAAISAWENDFATVSKNREGFVGTTDAVLPVVYFNDEGGAASLTVQSARASSNGTFVTVEGIVTRALGAFTRIQDATGGLTIYQPGGPIFSAVLSGSIRAGDQIKFTGRINEFRFLKQIDSVSSYLVSSRDNTLPVPKPVNLFELEQRGESYESQLVTVSNLLLLSAPDSIFAAARTYNVEDNSNNMHSVAIRIPNATDTRIVGASTAGTSWTFRGILGQYHLTDSAKGYQLLPVLTTDFVPATPTQTSVTFRVSMAVPAAKGLFNPATDMLIVRGDFAHFVGKSDWDGADFVLTKAAGDTAYAITIPMPDSVAGKAIQYKFVYLHKPDTGLTVTTWENDPNRGVLLASGNQILPTVYFSNEAPTTTTDDSQIVLLTLQSTVLGGTRNFNILLPPNYFADTARYPVLYLFRGREGEWVNPTQDGSRRGNIKTVYDSLYASGRIGKMIIVMPGIGDPPSNAELTYVLDEIIPFVDAQFRTLPTRWRRGMDGFSYGGFDVMSLLWLRPDAFCTAGAFDGVFGYYDMTRFSNADESYWLKARPIKYLIHSAAVVSGSINNIGPTQDFVNILTAKGATNAFSPFILDPVAAHNWYYADLHMATTMPLHWQQFQVSLPNTPTTVPVVFRVNMKEYIRTGRFLKATDSVKVRGIESDWTSGVRMYDADNDDIYTVTLPIAANSSLAYKFWVSSVNHANGGWENSFSTASGNREVVIGAGADSLFLPVVYFDDASSLPMLSLFSQNSNVTIEVDMRPAYYFRADSGYVPHTAGRDLRQIQNVLLNGPVSRGADSQDWAAWDSVLFGMSSRQLHDDGSLGDVTAGDSIFTFVRTFATGAPRSYIGKFSTNGMDAEASFGKNHTFTFPDAATSSVRFVFGAIDTNGTLTDDFGPSRENPGTYDDYIRIADTSIGGMFIQTATVVRSGGYPEVGISTADVAFSVNMNYYIQERKFEPAKDTVFIRGSFSNWDPIPLRIEQGGIYSTTLPFPKIPGVPDIIGSMQYEYKFWFRNGQYPQGLFEDSVGTGANGNRVFTYINSPLTLPTVFFNNEMPLVAGSWNAALRIVDEFGYFKELHFGEHPLATIGLDTALGEADLPPLPPAGILDARFQLPGTSLTSLMDLRDTVHVAKTWTFTYRPGASTLPVALTWDRTQLPAGAFLLRDAVTGSLITVDMKAQDSYTVTNTAITMLTIEYTTSLQSSVMLSAGWNMLSIPLTTSDMTVNGLFPTAASQAFGFADGYTTVTSFLPGKGYWLKFAAAETRHIQGSKNSGKITVPGGWTMIGIHERNIAVNAIASTPASIITSQFFGFGPSGYVTVDTLKSGKGYWVKTSASGSLETGMVLAKQASQQRDEDVLAKVGRITITDADGRSKVLYAAAKGNSADQFALPPVPPSGIYDVRYRTGEYAKNLAAGEIVDVRGATYPISVRVDGMAIVVQDVVGGSVLYREMKSGEELTVRQSALNAFLVKENAVPLEFALEQNYPNPFNPSTAISFSLPEDRFVRLTVFNTIGQEVAQLVNEQRKAGTHQVEFSALNLPSNVYFYKLEAGSFVAVKKMMLLK